MATDFCVLGGCVNTGSLEPGDLASWYGVLLGFISVLLGFLTVCIAAWAVRVASRGTQDAHRGIDSAVLLAKIEDERRRDERDGQAHLVLVDVGDVETREFPRRKGLVTELRTGRPLVIANPSPSPLRRIDVHFRTHIPTARNGFTMDALKSPYESPPAWRIPEVAGRCDPVTRHYQGVMPFATGEVEFLTSGLSLLDVTWCLRSGPLSSESVDVLNREFTRYVYWAAAGLGDPWVVDASVVPRVIPPAPSELPSEVYQLALRRIVYDLNLSRADEGFPHVAFSPDPDRLTNILAGMAHAYGDGHDLYDGVDSVEFVDGHDQQWRSDSTGLRKIDPSDTPSTPLP